MTRIADIIADTLVAEIKSRTEWDEAPGLYFLYLERGGGAGRVSFRCRTRYGPRTALR